MASPRPSPVRRFSSRIAAVLIAVVLYGFARLPVVSPDERQALASQFCFDTRPLSALPGSGRSIRAVNPSVERISAWISSVGASVAFGDIDGDGFANDFCLVDPRSDRVSVESVPIGEHRLQPFVLTTPDVAANPTIAPMGCRLGDFNEDGLTDVLVYYWGRTPVVFLRRGGDAGSRTALQADQFRAVDVVSGGPVWNTNAVTVADIDGDGHMDLVVGNYFPDGATMLDPHSPTPVSMQNSMARAFNGGVNRILRWTAATAGADPTVTFTDVPGAFPDEVARGWTLAAGAADLDGDLLPEIYFANDFGPDRLLHNRSRPGEIHLVPVEGRKRFTTPNSKVLGRDSFKGMGIDFGDLNGDGRLDIFVSNIANEYALEESHFAFVSQGEIGPALAKGIAPYVDASEDLGLSRSGFSWEARLADFNNDGVLEAMQAAGFVRGRVNHWPELQELAMGNNLIIENPNHWPRFQAEDDISGHLHNPFFVRGASGRYVDLAEDIGIGEPQVARGIATGDVDGDGRLDFAVARQWDAAIFRHNCSQATGSVLELRLQLPAERGDTRLARPAVGAQAIVTLPDGRRLVGFVDGGNGHSGARAPELHFGLGATPPGMPIRVDLSWRDAHGAAHQETRSLPAGAPAPLDGQPHQPAVHTILLGAATGGRS